MDDTDNSLRRKAAGFTLIELMVAIAVLAMSIYSIQGFAEMVAEANARAARQAFLTVLAMSRQEAITRNRRVTLCRAASPDSCSGSAVVGRFDWESALLFVDADRDRLYNPDSDRLIRYIDLSDRVSVSWNHGEAISYQPDGSVTGYSNGTFTLRFGDEQSCTVVLALTGRVRETCR